MVLSFKSLFEKDLYLTLSYNEKNINWCKTSSDEYILVVDIKQKCSKEI